MIKNELVKEIINKISNIIPTDFGINVDADDESSLTFDDIYDTICNNYKAEVYHGVTKCVIVLKNEDEVIKIPFNGKFEDRYDNEIDEYDTDFIPFEYANIDVEDASTTWDYCENEYIKYEKAVEDGYADFLLKTNYCGLINGIPVYTQEKAEEFWSSQYSDTHKIPLSKDAISKYKNESSNRFYTSIHHTWVVRAIAYYGAEKVADFLQWAKDNGLAGDLHTGNIGFTSDGRPILLDWAGYRE